MGKIIRNQVESPDFHLVYPEGPILESNHVLNDSNTFGVFDPQGNILQQHNSLLGVYYKGTRFISHFTLMINSTLPLLLSSAIKDQNEMLSVDLTNYEFKDVDNNVIPQGKLHITKRKFVRDGGCYEEVSISNYGNNPYKLYATIQVEGDFRDIFEVRGAVRNQRGSIVTDGDQKKYLGLDNIKRWIRINANPTPTTVHPLGVQYYFDLPPGQSFTFDYEATFHIENDKKIKLNYPDALSRLKQDLEFHREIMADIYTSNEQFTHWLNRSRTDLISLLAITDSGFFYPYAGVPWYNTAFGRDGLLTAYQTLWVAPNISKNVLLYLAEYQARTENAAKDSEPGKILHEMRDGEMANTGEIPFDKYYGTIDATPLFVMLAGAYYQRTDDLETIRMIWPNIQKAIEWIDQYGDLDNDGFVEYQHKAENGLTNQGWKDSFDAISYANGALAEPPIALCEVQGYVYDAKRKAALLAKALDQPIFKTIKSSAEKLKKKFNQKFWDDELQCYVLALDGKKNPCRVKSSNAGQTLFTGIVNKSRIKPLANTLLSEEMFSGWGIRTLATDAPRYNPVSYHNGSVWPHDVALIAEGLASADCPGEAMKMLTGLFNASLFVDQQRLPELFCGFSRREGEGPTKYPVACSPQAWSVASVFMLLKACLRVEINAQKKEVSFKNPQLPPYLEHIHIKDLAIGNSYMSMEIIRYEHDVGITIKNKPEDWKIVVLK